MNQILLIDDHSMILNGLASFFQNNSWEICAQLKSLAEVHAFLAKFKANDSAQGNSQGGTTHGKSKSSAIQGSPTKNNAPIALVDIELGNDSGFDAIGPLQDAGIQVVMYSMYSSPSYVVKSIDLGAKGYVSKSASDTELLAAVESVAKGEPYIQKNLVPSLMFSANVFTSLTSKEKKIIECVRQHCDNAQIAAALGITKRTVENHLSRIYDKFGVKNKHELEEKIM